ncbi:MAG: cytochrome o ubiquinol oxidase subunit IV [Pseudomonadota bacterium]
MEQHPKATRYLIGFALAVLLTAIPFGGVWSGLLTGTLAFVVIAIAAVLQVAVHLIFFLHISLDETPAENLFFLAFAGVLIFIMVGGTLWIMFDLHARMM